MPPLKFFGVTGDGSIMNLVWKRMVRTQVIVEQQTPSVTGEATFLNEFNRIELSGVHLLEGLAVGDVVEVTGSNNGDNDKAIYSDPLLESTPSKLMTRTNAGEQWTDLQQRSLAGSGFCQRVSQ